MDAPDVERDIIDTQDIIVVALKATAPSANQDATVAPAP
jgi:hypothetical protein